MSRPISARAAFRFYSGLPVSTTRLQSEKEGVGVYVEITAKFYLSVWYPLQSLQRGRAKPRQLLAKRKLLCLAQRINPSNLVIWPHDLCTNTLSSTGRAVFSLGGPTGLPKTS